MRLLCGLADWVTLFLQERKESVTNNLFYCILLSRIHCCFKFWIRKHMYRSCCRFCFFTRIFLWSSSDYLHIFLYWRKNHKFFPNLREQNIQSFLTLCFFIEGKLSVICCVIIIQKEENTSRYIRPSLSCSNLGLWSLSDRKHIVAYAPLIFCFFL